MHGEREGKSEETDSKGWTSEQSSLSEVKSGVEEIARKPLQADGND